MCIYPLLVSTSVLLVVKSACGTEDTYSAVVVEYSPAMDPTLDADTNILNNVHNYVNFINTANSDMLADIIVFPEIGLKGYGNQDAFMEIPDPKEKVQPCTANTSYAVPLVQLSCAARATATYVVVNLSEKFYNSTLGRYLYFNTDVVFDQYGQIIARYRKIHLFNEKMKQSPVEKELVYFDTEFGVRFGLFTCFDIIFKTPGVDLAELYGISHFIFLSAWFSEMPFLTALQEQWYWSFTQDVVLLAAGYNLPSVGSSGTALYLGRQGPLGYTMTETRGSFMLQAHIPKQLHPPGNGTTSRRSVKTLLAGLPTGEKSFQHGFQQGVALKDSTGKFKVKRDFLEVYLTESIAPPADAPRHSTGADTSISFSVEKSLCQNNLCCNFTLQVTAVFSPTRENISRGDDYSQLHYRMAVFDGVKTYDHIATGGVQTCAIIPCVAGDLASCALRADNPLSQPGTLDSLYQTKFIFEAIEIIGVFSNSDAFVGPNVLLRGEGDDFGALLGPGGFLFYTNNETGYSVVKRFRTVTPLAGLVTASLYSRLFSRDGQAYTGSSTEQSSSNINLTIDLVLLLISIVLLKYSLS